MGLISYTNLEDGNPAGSNDINQRFGDVLAQVNGNLDASNIRNGTITRELFSTDAISSAWPVNSIYISVDDANPGTLLGGSWVRFGEGKTLIGVDDGDPDFNDSEKTGGTKTVSLTSAQNGPHTHAVNPPATNTSSDSHNHSLTSILDNNGGGSSNNALTSYPGANIRITNRTTSSDSHRHSVDIPQFNSGSSGTGAAHNNLQPYITVYFWKRVS